MKDSRRSENSGKELEKETFLLVDENVKLPEASEGWANRIEFLLALIGYTVGIGSIWRFPILCIRNGGGAFLLPVCLTLLLIGGPMYYLEINLGQFTGKGVSKAFEFCPLIKGSGYLMLTLTIFINWYLTVIPAWILYYLYNSFWTPLPWATCDNDWNTPQCHDGSCVNSSRHFINVSTDICSNNHNTTNKTSHPALEFWTRKVLHQSDGLEEIGTVQLHLAVCLLLAWIMSILGVIKGVKILGKVVYVTVLFPYVLLTILLVRGLTLDGSIDGILFLLKFESYRMADYQVWLDASVQVFYSLGPVWGCIITMSSHNQFHQPSFKDTIIICVVDMFTAVYASFVVFSVIGFMAKQSGLPIEEIASSSGPGLAFVAYPIAVSLMPLPQLWAVLFFLMMILVFLDSNFGMVETVLYALYDQFPRTLGRRRVLVNLLYGGFMFLTSLILTTNGGVYLFQLLDWYVSAFGLLIGACLEVGSIALVYGIDRFSRDISMMTGRVMSKFSRFLYCIFIPISTLVTFVLMLTQYEQPGYGDKYKYKPYAVVLGFIIGLTPVFVVCVGAVVVLLQQRGSLIQRIRMSLRPSEKWGPKDQQAAVIYKQNPYVYKSTWLARMKTNLLGSTKTRLF